MHIPALTGENRDQSENTCEQVTIEQTWHELYCFSCESLKELCPKALSSAEASLCRKEAESAGHDGKGEEKREGPPLFPCSHRPPHACYFSIIAIFIGIPSGTGASAEENGVLSKILAH